MPMPHTILTPVLILIVWSLIMWIWMYATRIPAIQKAGLEPNDAKEPDAINVLPLSVRQVAYNYNHLMEQPTIFYALVFYTYLTGGQNEFSALMAWAYVVLRVAHSLVQATSNTIMVRFSLHVLGTLPLFVLAARDIAAVLRA